MSIPSGTVSAGGTFSRFLSEGPPPAGINAGKKAEFKK
jgi:hypothetical protein